MNHKRDSMLVLVAILCAMVVTIAALLGGASLDGLPLLMQLGAPFLLGMTTLLLILGARNQAQKDSRNYNLLARIFAAATVILLLLASWLSIQSLWISPSDATRDRSVMENISTGVAIGASVLTVVLTALQSDVYWLTKRRPGTLDERQIKERQEVFEKSYKFGVGLTLVVLWGYASSVDSIDRIKELAYASSTVPGHYLMPAYCLVIALVSLPLIVAAWSKRLKS